MSKNSPQKQERRRKRLLKKQRRTEIARVHRLAKLQSDAKLARVSQQVHSTFSKSAWSALPSADNSASTTQDDGVLKENCGFQAAKWKPNAEDS